MKFRDLTKWGWLDVSMDNVGTRSSNVWRVSLLGAKLIGHAFPVQDFTLCLQENAFRGGEALSGNSLPIHGLKHAIAGGD